jgi:hypothetical protein
MGNGGASAPSGTAALLGADAAAADIGAGATGQGGNATVPMPASTGGCASVNTRAELLRRLRQGGIANAAAASQCRRPAACGDDSPRKRRRGAPREVDLRLRPIQQLGGGVADELVHVAGSAACSAGQTPTAAMGLRAVGIAAAGCSDDSAVDLVNTRPVRQSVPAGARSCIVPLPSVTAESGLIRRRLVGKQNPDGKSRRDASCTEKDPGRGTATADAAQAEPTPAAPRQDEPPPA